MGATLAVLAIAAMWLVRRSEWWRGPDDALVVGRDGVHWSERTMPRFLRWPEIERVAVEPDGVQVRVVRIDGRAHTLVVDDADGVLAEILQARAAWWASDAVPPALALRLDGIAPHAVVDWSARARVAMSGDPYRAPPSPPEHLARIALDPHAEPDQRIGAALALAAADATHRDAVRRATEETADPDLARALREALDGRIDAHLVARAL